MAFWQPKPHASGSMPPVSQGHPPLVSHILYSLPSFFRVALWHSGQLSKTNYILFFLTSTVPHGGSNRRLTGSANGNAMGEVCTMHRRTVCQSLETTWLPVRRVLLLLLPQNLTPRPHSRWLLGVEDLAQRAGAYLGTSLQIRKKTTCPAWPGRTFIHLIK